MRSLEQIDIDKEYNNKVWAEIWCIIWNRFMLEFYVETFGSINWTFISVLWQQIDRFLSLILLYKYNLCWQCCVVLDWVVVCWDWGPVTSQSSEIQHIRYKHTLRYRERRYSWTQDTQVPVITLYPPVSDGVMLVCWYCWLRL